ncbi:TlpA disulfide reductase family protein [Arachidicoccus terrestris]|uniref:TlpA disulfide reductase family protein n=1 Tax=Arachidicoccus terrestris TaxID=2875539 RepID=UPI001CC64389|nr:TlpA disulfide reductase family protein [Arachidicoccus terrestris]UAY56063.1 AhpC/TSA family protein [Arachidicoccus terrestris]
MYYSVIKKQNSFIRLVLPAAFSLLLVTSGKTAAGQSGKRHSYRIEGSTNALDSGKITLYTVNLSDNIKTAIDSTGIEDGRFTFTGSIDSVRMALAIMQPGNIQFEFLLENNRLRVEADSTEMQYFKSAKTGSVTARYIHNVSETGSPDFQDIHRFRKAVLSMRSKAMAIFKLMNGAKDDAGLQKVYQARLDSLREVSLTQMRQRLSEYITAHPSTVAGPYMLWFYKNGTNDMSYETLQKYLVQFTGEATMTPYYADLTKEISFHKKLQQGVMAPDFTLLKPDSASFTLSKMQGKYILLDFWASWCGPCRAAIPHWKSIYKKYKDRGFEIISIASDRERSDWMKALSAEGMPWIQVCDEFPSQDSPSSISSLYLVSLIPRYFLLDKERKILVTGTESTAQIDQKLKEIFGE